MRFNKDGEGICQNYHPDYLKNLARSLGYGNFRVDQKQTGNMCKMVWLDGCGKFQTNNKQPYYEIIIPYMFIICIL